MERPSERRLVAGMDDYLSKPIKTEILHALLSQWGRVGRAGEAAPLEDAHRPTA